MFTRHDFTRSLVAACGGHLNGAYTELLFGPLWLAIEAIEAAADLNKPKGQFDLGDMLK